MKNKLIDLNNHLFAQLERLSDENIKEKKLIQEIDRSKAVSGIAREIIANAKLALDAQIALNDRLTDGRLPAMIGMDEDKSK